MEKAIKKNSLKAIEKLAATPARKKDYESKTDRPKISNKKILQIFLNICMEKDLDDSDQLALLEGLNELNEF